MTVTEAARRLQIAPSTLLRWLQDGFIGGEQITPGAPWCIRLTPELRARFVDEAPPGWLPMQDATKALGVRTASRLNVTGDWVVASFEILLDPGLSEIRAPQALG